MKFEPIGRIEESKRLDLEPVIVPIVGYDNDNNEVITDIRFKPIVPIGFALKILRSSDGNGNITQDAAIEYVDGCVFFEDRAKWQSLIESNDVNVFAQTIVDVYQKLGEFYSQRPLPLRSGSQVGSSITDETSTGAAREKKSNSTNSRSKKG